MNIEKDEMGWSIDLPCLNCGSDHCNGSVHIWLPNRKGNTKDGFLTEGEAVSDAKETQRTYVKYCLMFDNLE